MLIGQISLVLSIFILLFSNCEADPARIGEQRTLQKTFEDGEKSRMAIGRAVHTAVLLQDGKVLVSGGFTDGQSSLSEAEIFDPATNKFTSAGKMSDRRASHSATVLRDGRVLFAGGFDGDYLDTAEIYDPKTGKFSSAGKLTMPRSGHTAVLLENGKVLLAGGVGKGWTFLADAELYDPVRDTFERTGAMTAARESHIATLMNDGKVLITGGHRGRRSAITIYSSAEVYDPSVGSFTYVGDMTIRRHKHDAVLLQNGKVLVIGGSDERDGRGAYTSVETYDPKKSTFTKTGDMRLSRYKLQGTSVLLGNGKVLIAGGADQPEVFDPASGVAELVDGQFGAIALFSTATLLPDGRVLVIGGYDDRIRVSADAHLLGY